MKKVLVLLFMVLCTSFTTYSVFAYVEDGDEVLDWYYYTEDGIDYKSETEVVSQCSASGVFLDEYLEGRYLGWTREYALLGAYEDLIIGDIYYKFTGSYHQKYEIYDVCTVGEPIPVSVDMNSDAFYYQEYAAVMWEHDFSQLEQNEDYKNVLLQNVNQVLPIVTNEVEEAHYSYKTLYIKYDPELYNELALCFAGYRAFTILAAQENRDEADELYLSSITSVADVLFNDVVKNLICYSYKVYNGADPGDTLLSTMMDEYKEAMLTGNFEILEEMTGISKGMFQMAFDTVEGTINSTSDVDNLVLGDVVTAFACSLAENMVSSALNILLGTNPIGFMYLLVTKLLLASYYDDLAELYELLTQNIDEMMASFMPGNDYTGQNLRIDYLIYSFPSGLYTEDYSSLYSLMSNIDRLHCGLKISYAKTDVVNEFVTDELIFDTYQGGDDVYFKIKGNITLLTKPELENELNEAFEIYTENTSSEDVPPAFQFEEEFLIRYITNGNGGLGCNEFDLEPVYTVDRNILYDTDTLINMPGIEVSNVVVGKYNADIDISCQNSSYYFNYAKVKIYKYNALYRVYTITNPNSYIDLNSLTSNTTYKIVITTNFDSKVDDGTIELVTDIYTFTTKRTVIIGKPFFDFM